MITNTLSLLLIFSAFSALSIHMNRHTKAVLGYALTARQIRILGWCGWALLGLSLTAPVMHYGASIGCVVWCGWLSVAAVAVALFQTYYPALIRILAPIALTLGALCGLVIFFSS